MALNQVGLERLGTSVTDKIGENKNLIINGAMNVAQRGTSSTGLSANGYYTLDRFQVFMGSTDGRVTMSQVADVHDGFANALKFECTTADTSIGASENLGVRTLLEGQDLQQIQKGSSGAKQLTLSFYVKGNANATYTCELNDKDNDRVNAQTFNVTTSWSRVSLTFAADTTGAFDDDNNASLQISLWLHAGSTFTSGTFSSNTWASRVQANRVNSSQTSFLDSTSRTFFITGVQLEVGSVATDFEHRSFGQELLLCQRYYQRLKVTDGNAGTGILRASNSSNFQQLEGMSQIVKMRAAASGSVISSNSTLVTRRLNGSTSDNTCTLSFAGGSADFAHVAFRFTTATGTFTNTEPYACWDDGNGAIEIQQDAEL